MDLMQTPPHSISHVAYFGEEPFLWAPKKPQEYRKPPLRAGRKTSSRSLDFSTILVQDEEDENSSFLGSYERRQGQLRSRGSRHETPVFLRNLDSPVRSHGSPLAFENTIARRIDFASQSLTPGQDGVASTSDSPSVFSPGLSPTAREILSQLKRSASSKRPTSQEKQSASRMSNQQTPESCSPRKRARWTRLIR